MEEQTSDLQLSQSETEIPVRDRQDSVLAILFPQKNILRSLSELCVRTLALAFGPDPLPLVAEDPMKLLYHYDTLDVDMPLAKCYHIANERFWTRVVLAKHPDKSLAIRRNVAWKNVGVTLKYVEILESESVEYWPEAEMTDLAKKIQEFVTDLHIRRLRSLQERSFEKYFHPQSSSEEEDAESVSAGTESSVPTSVEEDPMDFPVVPDDQKTESQLHLERQRASEKVKRKRARQMLREDKANARLERLARRQRREARRLKREPSVAVVKKKRKRNPKSFFDIEISEGEEDDEKYILDWRNKELLLNHKKSYNYPSQHCHHIDLRFVQHLRNLDTFVIEFLGPLQGRSYHQRHLKFSHDDIKRLAQGIGQLPVLRVFRLRHSLMDAEKLLTLVRGLKNLKCLETIDFGFDNLEEDSASAFYELFENTSSIKSLELESNQLGVEVLQTLGETLQNYSSGCLEYLGLSRNPINDEALHALVSAVKRSSQVKSLSLRGVNGLSQTGLKCCVVDELLRQHFILRKLDLTGVPLGKEVCDCIITALEGNEKILAFDCYGCGLDEETEMDITVLMKRNQFIAENPYVGDETKTDEEIDAWLNRTKNPILLQVLAERETLTECPTNIFKDFMPPMQEPSLHQIPPQESTKSERSTSEEDEEDVQVMAKPKPKIFIERPYVDPEANNLYLKNFKAKFDVWNQLKNVSLV